MMSNGFATTSWYRKNGLVMLNASRDILIAKARCQMEGWSNYETVYTAMCIDGDRETLTRVRAAFRAGLFLSTALSASSPGVNWRELTEYYANRFNAVKEHTEAAINKIHRNVNMELTIGNVLIFTAGLCSADDVIDYMHEEYGWE